MDGSTVSEVQRTMDDVHLVVPAASEFLRVVRLAAADAAQRSGLDCEEVEDFRIGVDELCHTVMSATDHHLHVRFRVSDECVVAYGNAQSRGGSVPPQMSELSRTIVAGLSDDFDFSEAAAEITFKVVKRAGHQMVGPA